MKKLILIGDSIRMSYQDVVERELAGLCEIWRPAENGGTSANVLAHLDAWVIEQNPSIVHLNCGLHDIKRDFGESRHNVPIQEYRNNLEEIFTRIRNKTQAEVIWAATTPVNEAWHHERKGFDRFEADVLAYNEVAAEVATRLDLRIDDLYQVVMDAGRDDYLGPDGVHFNEEGRELLGKAVAEFIRPLL